MIPHRTPEWWAARLGRLTASRIHDATARIKTGWGASRANYRAELVVERMTGIPTEHYVSPAMQWGIDTEAEARAAYAFERNVAVIDAGFIEHPTIPMAGASPDGLVGDDGLVEFKCPLTAQHIDVLLGGAIPDKYVKQMLWQLACCPERKWVDWVSYDPRMPPEMRLFIWRLERDDDRIGELEDKGIGFLAEVELQVAALNERYRVQRAA
jgi:putative phage-type endonuclease